jgi:chemotaxis protein methyltransferase CheR
MKVSVEVGRRFRELVALRLGLAFPEARQTDLEQGLSRACQSSRISTPEPYVAWLATLSDQSPEWKRLASHLTVGETYFFRDPALFEALEKQILPSLIAARRAQGMLQLRLWSAGCATGEEPYSLAIILDRLLPDRSRWALTILATDINLEALHVAQQGTYRQWSFRNTPDWVRTGYFHHRDGETFEVAPGMRQTVVFAPLNLNDGSYPSVVTNTVAMDLIFCRNVLMYFTPQAQRATVARLREALVTGGWLVVSPVEASAELLRPLVPVQCSGAILYHKEDSGSPLAFAAERSAVTSSTASREAKPALPNISNPRPLVKAQPDAASLLQRARDLADQGQLDEAHRLCERALARDQFDPEAHLLLAAICQERGEVGTALEALRKAIYLDPDSAPAHFLLGSLLLRQGEQRRGQRSMETAVGLLSARPRDEVVPGTDGLSAGPLLDMARAYLELGR